MDSAARASRKEVVSLHYKRFSSSTEKLCLSEKMENAVTFLKSCHTFKTLFQEFCEILKGSYASTIHSLARR